MSDERTWGVASAACGARCECCARAQRVAEARNGVLWGFVLFSLGCLVTAAWCVGEIGRTVEKTARLDRRPALRSPLRLAVEPGDREGRR